MSKRIKRIIGVLLGSILVVGTALAFPSRYEWGWEITYYNEQGDIVGGSDYPCGLRVYNWGQVTPIYDRIDFRCPGW